MRSLFCVLLMSLLCLVSPVPAFADPSEILLTGNEKGLWLVKPTDDASRFQVVVKHPRKQWSWVTAERPGTPVTATALSAQLHVFLQNPFGYVLLSGEPNNVTIGLNPDDPRWIEGVAPIATCEAVGFAQTAAPTLIAAVPMVPPTTTGSGDSTPVFPMRKTGSINLGLFQKESNKWTYLTELPQLQWKGETRVSIATVGSTLYVAIREGQTKRVATWSEGQWKDLPLPASIDKTRLVGIATIKQELILVVSEPTDTDKQQLKLALFNPSREKCIIQTLTTPDTKPAAWDKKAVPHVARLGEQLAILWKDNENLKLSLCNPPSGRILITTDVEIFRKQPLDARGNVILRYFEFLVLTGLVIGTIFIRPREIPSPFSLPDKLRPANLGKRIAASLIDLVPFIILGLLVFPPPVELYEHDSSRRMSEVLSELQRNLPTEFAHAIICALILHAVYCGLMEFRSQATLGKRIFKLRIVGNRGVRPDLRAIVLRTLWRIIELNIPLLLLVVPLSRHRRRLGDFLARTVVVEGETAPSQHPDPPNHHSEPPER